MPEYTHVDLAADREASGIKQWQVARACHVSESQIKRWEAGRWKQKDCRMPDPDDIWRYLKCIGRTEQFPCWMRSHYDGFREWFKDPIPVNDEAMALMHAKKEAQDFVNLWGRIEKALVTGEIGKVDTGPLRDEVIKEAKDALSSFANAVAQLEKGIST